MNALAFLVPAVLFPLAYAALFADILSQGILFGGPLTGAAFSFGALVCGLGLVDVHRYSTTDSTDDLVRRTPEEFLYRASFAYAMPLLATLAVLFIGSQSGDPPWLAALTPMLLFLLLAKIRLNTFHLKQRIRHDFEASHVRGPQIDRYSNPPHPDREPPSSPAEGIRFGNELIPFSPIQHFAVIGMARSGKTTTMLLLMESLLPRVRTQPDTRAVIYDPKRNFLRLLEALKLYDHTKLLHPYDKRSHAWDIAADLQSAEDAQTFVSIMIQGETTGQNAHFVKAPRAILKSVFISLNDLAPGKWTLRDLVWITRDEVLLRRLLERSRGQAYVIPKYLSAGEVRSVMSCLETDIGKYETVAAFWDELDPQRKVSLRKWLKSNDILLLGQGGSASEAVNEINQLIIHRITQLVQTELAESSHRRMYFFLDELRFAGRLNTLNELLALTGGMGTQAFLAFQDFRGLIDVYSEDRAAEITGQCSNFAFYKLNDEKTKQFASEKMGTEERFETIANEREGSEGKRRNRTLADHVLVMPDEFATIRLPQPATGLDGYYVTDRGRAPGHTSSREYERLEKLLATAKEKPFDKKPDAVLRKFDDEDLKRLGLLPESDSDTSPPNHPTPPRSPFDEVTRRKPSDSTDD